MEELLLSLQRDREYQSSKDQVDTNGDLANPLDFSLALSNLATALKRVLPLLTEPPPRSTTKREDEAPAVTVKWLLDICSRVPSDLDAAHLARAVWEISQLPSSNQQEAALFDVLGASDDAMNALIQINSNIDRIFKLREKDLAPSTSTPNGSSTNSTAVVIDPEEELRQQLLQEARSAAQVAAIAKAEAESFSTAGAPGQGVTHTVMRKSERQAQKDAQKAAKKAAQALKRAKDAGAIVDESDFMATNMDTLQLGSGGLLGRSSEELQELQRSLLPEGTRQYYEQRGLPKGTIREDYEDFELVTIPAVYRDESKLPPRLKIHEIMDDAYAKAFEGTTSLNPMQSKVFDMAFHHRDNLLICAPTGAGKTNVAMLTVVAHFRDVGLIGHDSKGGGMMDTGKKVVYIAPMKALAQEVVEKFSAKLNPLRLVVRELTGDMQLTRAEAESAHVIVTTPEKWDVVTRKSGNDENSLGNQCGVLIIDEVHLLADDRGAVIESVVARLHRLVESRQRQIRIVGLSATLPNYEDVAAFLQVTQQGLFFFGPEHRPVPLQQQFIGVKVQSRQRAERENKMNEVCYDIVVDSLRKGHQVMIFVHSRKGTGETASALTERARDKQTLERYFVTKGKEGPSGEAYKRYADRAKKSRNREVSNHFESGMGIHHAGMLRHDRKLTEQMFSDGAIKVLCCTATLAWGINLPAHTVVVKGTEVYNAEKGKNVDLSILDVQQIFGRAGRPQFDTSGEATLITSHDALSRYLDKLVRAVPIESNFMKQLADHLNAEVVGGTVTTIDEAATWLTYTYLYVRMLRNPMAYGVNPDQKADDPTLRGRSLELVADAAKLLDSTKMIRFSLQSGNLSFTELGRVAAHYYIQAESVSNFNEMLEHKEELSDVDLLRVICHATEFENVRIRQDELRELAELASKACPMEAKAPINESVDKCMVLMQAYISRANIRSFTLISDTNYIASNAGRVARAFFEMSMRKNKAFEAMKMLRIAKSVDKQIWWFQTPLRHFEGELPGQVLTALETRAVKAESGYDSLETALSLLDMDPNEVGHLCNFHKGGHKIHNLIHFLPQFHVECRMQPVTATVINFHVVLTPSFTWNNRWHGGAQSFWLWIENPDTGRIFQHENIIITRREFPKPIALDLIIPIFTPRPKQYAVRIASDTWVGVEALHIMSLQDIKIPEMKTPYTKLMDLTPLPTSALREPRYKQLFSKFKTFNPIQTLLFHVLYHTDRPVLLGAPTGSGKTTVAELALLRMKLQHPDGVCVYIAPLRSLARERLKEWQQRLGGHPLNWKVLELSGDTHHDKNALSRADVLVCTPEKWDLVSRGWRTRDDSVDGVSNGRTFVKRVKLLVIDEIHLLGEERGAVLEAIVSRTRFISRLVEQESANSASKVGDAKQKDRPEVTRIIGLSTAIANPFDLADWIGIGSGQDNPIGLYNFHPSVRPIPMMIHMQGFSGKHYCPRMATMNKPCYAAIKDHSPDRPTLIFVASRRQTRLTAFDIISYAAWDGNPKVFLGCSEDFIESVIETIHDEALRHTMAFGIGLHHAGLSSQDRDAVERLYLNGDIRVLVATATLAWGVNLPAHFVIVKGTEYYDGKTSRYIDYPLTDVLQMIGRAGRPGFDTSGVALVMVSEEKKNFYKRFLYEPFPVESCLKERLCENMNAEIASGTINSVIDALGYLTWTYFARRVKANPSFYGAESGSDEHVEEFLLSIVKETLAKLREHGCVQVDTLDEVTAALQPTSLGIAASNFYLQHRTPKQMDLGIRQARKMIMSSLGLPDASNGNKPQTAQDLDVRPFERSMQVDEVSIAWILYALSATHEFDELPVRHNEEILNQELSKDLMWGPDTNSLVSGTNQRQSHNVDIFADPHTKCFLLIQAQLERAKLPISDYVNDTKSVLDQLPRLLAAMQFIAEQDGTAVGSFELLCQFSKTRQLMEARTRVDEDPLLQIEGFTTDLVRKVRDDHSLHTLRSLSQSEAGSLLRSRIVLSSKKSNVDGMIAALYAIPSFRIDSATVAQEVDKATCQVRGLLKTSVTIDPGYSRGKRRDDDSSEQPCNLSLIVGTWQQRKLLAHKKVGFHQGRNTSPSSITKDVDLNFDWKVALADSGSNGGWIILRVILDEFRGLDLELNLQLV